MNQQIIEANKEIQIENIYNFIRKLNQSKNASEDAHWVETPASLVDEMISNINLDGKILVLFNVDIMLLLLKVYKVSESDIVFLSDDSAKNKVCDKVGVKYINSIEELKEMNMKFDVTLANYPFADSNDSGGAPWGKFSKLVFDDLLNPNGISAAIHPPSFIGKHLESGTGKSDYTVFRDNQIKEIHIFDNQEKNKYFSGVGTKICWYIASKSTPTEETKIVGYDNGEKYSFDVDFTKQTIMPQTINRLSMSIHNKIVNQKSLNFKQTRELHYYTMKKRNQVSDNVTSEYQYKSYFSHLITRFSNFMMEDYNSIKVMIPQTSTISKGFIDQNCNVSEDLFYVQCDSMAEAENKLSYLQGDLASYIGKMYRPGRNLGALLKSGIIPESDSGIEFTQEEIDYIESNVK